MSYVDGFVVAVPTAKMEPYKDIAERASKVFVEYGALHIVECWGDDVPEGKLTSFPMAVKCEQDETVVLSWIVWPSKEVRDAGMAKVMDDPRMAEAMASAPFDTKRMIFGGFRTIVDHRAD
ncbi:DUF1428 domain-containing protein [Thalassobaculum salexigens]|uniref:DUF1428 domain-containing protein n=1 Tax=Thalassobaculum salexigens TaxID=455360 RepID=UPI000425D5C5|nr:DUF1428 domain-containing protein [Thalassobaculum salexigens]